jgi:hypothetical protein
MKERNRNRQLVTAVAFLFVGMMGIWGMGDSALDKFRSVDVLRLLAAGACLGVAMVATVQYLRGSRPGGP